MTSFRQRVRQSGPAKAANPGGIKQRVRYLAAPSPYASMEMEVELYKARVGVNGDLRGADTWNRIGQDKPVFVYKPVAAGSIEEKILAMQEKKAALAAGILSEDARAVSKFSADDLDALLAPLPDD